MLLSEGILGLDVEFDVLELDRLSDFHPREVLGCHTLLIDLDQQTKRADGRVGRDRRVWPDNILSISIHTGPKQQTRTYRQVQRPTVWQTKLEDR